MKKTIISTALAALTVIGFGSASTAHADGTTPPPWDFYSVPQLGQEPVRGTGCGGDGSIGDAIPDGYWRGYLASDDGTSIQFDLACVYVNQVPDSTPVPDGWLVNNKTRTRTVSRSPSFFVSGTRQQADGAVPFFQTLTIAEGGNFDGDNDPFDGTDAWLYIENGQAQWLIGSPVAGGPVQPQSGDPAEDAPTSFGSFLEYMWDNFTDVDQQTLCNEVPVSGALPAWAVDLLPDALTDADLKAFVAVVVGACDPASAPPPPPTANDLRIPGPSDFSSPLLSGYHNNWTFEIEVGDPSQLASDTQALSGLTGWQWSEDMVIALGASFCNDGWEWAASEDGTYNGLSENGRQTWADAIAPVLGIDATGARQAIDASFESGTIQAHQWICQ